MRFYVRMKVGSWIGWGCCLALNIRDLDLAVAEQSHQAEPNKIPPTCEALLSSLLSSASFPWLDSPPSIDQSSAAPFLEWTVWDAHKRMWLSQSLLCTPSSPPTVSLRRVLCTVSLLLLLIDLFVLHHSPPPTPPAQGSCTHTGAFGADLARSCGCRQLPKYDTSENMNQMFLVHYGVKSSSPLSESREHERTRRTLLGLGFCPAS